MSAAFSVVAIIAAFNEADIIEQVVGNLIDQGIHVYFLDDGSTDRTVAAVQPYLGRGLLGLERRDDAVGDATPAAFEWERILLRKAQLARQLDADWFIHHDADEFRESPWPHLTLKDAIQHVDALGFNAIDFTSLDFWPVHDNFRAGDDVRAAFPFYAERAPYDRVQIRCWKKAADVDLASSGGHDASFRDRHVFPVRFILRHYPIRGQAHGERKVFQERQNRFLVHERARGWHVQYDDAREGASFIRDRATLTPYDADTVRFAQMLRHRGVEALEASLGDATRAVQAQQSEIELRDAELARTRSELEQQDAELARMRSELEQQDAELARTRKELEQHDAELARTAAELDARTAEAGALRRDLTERLVELDAMRVDLDAHAARLRLLDAELNARSLEIETRGAAISHLHETLGLRAGDLERLRYTVGERTRLLDELHHSVSWRWTSPLRAIARLLRLR